MSLFEKKPLQSSTSDFGERLNLKRLVASTEPNARLRAIGKTPWPEDAAYWRNSSFCGDERCRRSAASPPLWRWHVSCCLQGVGRKTSGAACQTWAGARKRRANVSLMVSDQRVIMASNVRDPSEQLRIAPSWDAIPVMRPMLPSIDHILPYLRQIDQSRIYSNFGPLSRTFEERLAGILKVSECAVVCASSGTSALIGAILAQCGPAKPERQLAFITGLTFPATAAAAERCGYTPYFIDVDPETWLIDPEAVRNHPRLAEVGLVVPVASFGRPVPQEPWKAFSRETGIPIVIDGAASFASITAKPEVFVGTLPVAISFHATKSFGVGEGGCVVWSEPDGYRRLCQAVNFGFFNFRASVAANFNGKMSEYHSAVGLAELDGWLLKQRMLTHVARTYQRVAKGHGFRSRMLTYPVVDFIYPMFDAAGGQESRKVQKALDRANIGWRLWYGAGMAGHAFYQDYARDDLSVCTSLAERLIGLPIAPDLNDDQCEFIGTVIAQAIDE